MEANQNKPEKAGADVAEFCSTLAADGSLYWHDVLASIAHVKALAASGAIPQKEADRIDDALVGILADLEKGTLEATGAQSIRAFIEGELVKRVGAVGKKLTLGRSPSDVEATDLRLYMKDAIVAVSGELKDLVETLIAVADANIRFYMPGYAHGKVAGPVNAALLFNAYSEMFLRDIERLTDCYKRTDVMPLASGSGAGANYPVDRKAEAEMLSFSEITQNAADAVSDRDFALEFLFCASTAILHLGKLAEEILRLTSDEFGFAQIGDDFLTSDESTPWRKNPVALELVRGKAGRVYGNLMSALTSSRSLPLAVNADTAELLEPLFDSRDTVLAAAGVIDGALRSLSFDTRAMRFAATGNFSAAGEVCDYLIEKGMSVRDAQATTEQIVRYCRENGTTLERLDAESYQNFSTLFGEDILDAIRIRTSTEKKCTVGGTARAAVRENIRSVQRRLARMFR